MAFLAIALFLHGYGYPPNINQLQTMRSAMFPSSPTGRTKCRRTSPINCDPSEPPLIRSLERSVFYANEASLVVIPHVMGVIALNHCLPRSIDRQLRTAEKTGGFGAKFQFDSRKLVGYRHFAPIFLAGERLMAIFKPENKKNRLSVLK